MVSFLRYFKQYKKASGDQQTSIFWAMKEAQVTFLFFASFGLLLFISSGVATAQVAQEGNAGFSYVMSYRPKLCVRNNIIIKKERWHDATSFCVFN